MYRNEKDEPCSKEEMLKAINKALKTGDLHTYGRLRKSFKETQKTENTIAYIEKFEGPYDYRKH